MEPDAHADLEVIDLLEQVQASDDELAASSRRPRKPRPGPTVPPPRPRWVLALVVVGVLLIAWGAVAAVTVLGMRDDVAVARQALVDGQQRLVAGDAEAATEAFASAAEDLEDLSTRVSSPLVWPVRAIPPYRRSLDAVGGLGRAGAIASDAAADVAAHLASEDGAFGSLTPVDGRLPLEAIAELGPLLGEAADNATTALEIARAVPVQGVDPAIVEGRVELIEELAPAAEALALGADLTEVLPAMFGADGPRRYVVLAANPAEARAGGGFLGAFSVLTVDDGQMTFSTVRETQELPIPADGAVPWPDPSLEARYDLYGGSSRIRSMNMTPDFPAAASTLESYWRTVMGEELDGVISVDPFAYEALLTLSGSLELEGFGEIPADEVVDFVTYSAYSLIRDSEVRKRLIGEVAIQALSTFLGGAGDVEPGQVLDAFGDMTRRNNLMIHATDPAVQETLVQTGLAGELTHNDGDLLAVFTNSGSGSKIDYYLDRFVRYDVELLDDGAVSGTVSAGFNNNAPTSGELTYMIGPPNPEVTFEAGDNILLTSVYCAPGCEFVEVPDAGYEDRPTTRGVELGFSVASTWLRLPSMRSNELVYSYVAPGAWTDDGEDRVYRLRYAHQTAIRSTNVEVHVAVPDGYTASALPDDAEVVDGEVVVRFDSLASRDLRVRFTPAG